MMKTEPLPPLTTEQQRMADQIAERLSLEIMQQSIAMTEAMTKRAQEQLLQMSMRTDLLIDAMAAKVMDALARRVLDVPSQQSPNPSTK